LGSKFGWPRAADRREGQEAALRHHQIDTQPGGTEGDLALPEIPGFLILNECGRGGMGIVYLAEQVDLGRRVALKFLKPELAGSASQRARLVVEATALARLQHPNIVQIFSTGTHEGRPFIVQEYVGGGSLDRKLTRQPAPARVAAEMVATLARAVEHAHGQRIIHRDLKPSNVLLTLDGVPKISDFGLAKYTDLDGETNQTQSGAIVGSPSYMAPEQSLGKRGTIGPAADIYALGAILYEMLTGRPPFLAASTLETLEQVRSADPVPPRQLQPGLPRDVETVCLKCLSKDPARRYATAAALADDIDRFLHGRPIVARPVSRAERLAKWVKRRPAIAASLGVAALALVALFGGGLIYQGLLRAAVREAKASAQLAREQEKKADARYRLARETLSKMLERFRDREFRQTPRLKELQRQQRDDALGFYREVVKDRENPDLAVRLDVATASLELSQVQHTLGRASEARDQVKQAIALLEGLVKQDPTRAEYKLHLARSYRVRGVLEPQPQPPRGPGSGTAAPLPDLVRSLELVEGLVRQDPANRAYRTELAVAYHDLGGFHANHGQTTQAVAMYRRAVDLRRSLLERVPSAADATVRVQMGETLQSLAAQVQQTEHKAEAPRLYAESRQLLEDALKVEPKWDDAALALGETLMNWGYCLTFDRASHQKAGTLLVEAIEHVSPILKREPDWDRVRGVLLGCHGALAQLRERDACHAEAASEWEQVVSLAGPGEKERYQCHVALARARAGKHREAWNLGQELQRSLGKRPAEYHFFLATVYAVCLAAAEKDSTLSAEDRSAVCSKCAVAGVELLRQTLELVPSDERTAQRALFLSNVDLASLRGRREFQDLIADAPPAGKLTPGAASAPPGSK